MALNAIERRMLVLAREKLVKRKLRRICYAIAHAKEDMKRGPEKHCEDVQAACDRLVTFVMESIESFGLEDWVCNHGGEYAHAHHDEDFMRETRIAWLDWLLDEPWTDHNGGPCPLIGSERVHVRLRNGTVHGPRLDETIRTADTYRWDHWEGRPGPILIDGGPYDIVAYKVIYEAPRATDL